MPGPEEVKGSVSVNLYDGSGTLVPDLKTGPSKTSLADHLVPATGLFEIAQSPLLTDPALLAGSAAPALSPVSPPWWSLPAAPAVKNPLTALERAAKRWGSSAIIEGAKTAVGAAAAGGAAEMMAIAGVAFGFLGLPALAVSDFIADPGKYEEKKFAHCAGEPWHVVAKPEPAPKWNLPEKKTKGLTPEEKQKLFEYLEQVRKEQNGDDVGPKETWAPLPSTKETAPKTGSVTGQAKQPPIVNSKASESTPSDKAGKNTKADADAPLHGQIFDARTIVPWLGIEGIQTEMVSALDKKITLGGLESKEASRIKIPGKTVSKNHATLVRRRGEQWFLCDGVGGKPSRNGTWVYRTYDFPHSQANVKIREKLQPGEEVELSDGMEFMLGQVTLHFYKPGHTSDELAKLDARPPTSLGRFLFFEGTGLEKDALAQGFDPVASLKGIVERAAGKGGLLLESNESDRIAVERLMEFIWREVINHRMKEEGLKSCRNTLKKAGYEYNIHGQLVKFEPPPAEPVVSEALQPDPGEPSSRTPTIRLNALPLVPPGLRHYLTKFLKIRDLDAYLAAADKAAGEIAQDAGETRPSPNGFHEIADPPSGTYGFAYKKYQAIESGATIVHKEINDAWGDETREKIRELLSKKTPGPGQKPSSPPFALLHWFWGGIDPGKGAQVGRLYCSLQHAQAAEFWVAMSELKEALKADGINILFKMGTDLRMMQRADSAVVYFHAKDEETVYRAVSRIAVQHPSWFKGTIPLFAAQALAGDGKPIRGLSFGQNPAEKGESFGSKRAGAMTAANQIIRSMLIGKSKVSVEQAMQVMTQKLQEVGVNTQFPAFDIGGRKLFPFIFSHTDQGKGL